VTSGCSVGGNNLPSPLKNRPLAWGQIFKIGALLKTGTDVMIQKKNLSKKWQKYLRFLVKTQQNYAKS
jgi:hypothetical protein